MGTALIAYHLDDLVGSFRYLPGELSICHRELVFHGVPNSKGKARCRPLNEPVAPLIESWGDTRIAIKDRA